MLRDAQHGFFPTTAQPTETMGAGPSLWALELAVEANDSYALDQLLDVVTWPLDGVLPDQRDTLLSLSARRGHASCAHLLLFHGARVDGRLGEAGRRATPLYVAAQEGHEDLVELLLRHGAEMCARPSDRMRPLHAAAKAGHEQVVRLLLDAGAVVEAPMRGGGTPLQLAVAYGRLPVVRLLCARGALRSHTALGSLDETATALNHPDVVVYLRASGRWSPLAHLEALLPGEARELLRAGASLDSGVPSPRCRAQAAAERLPGSGTLPARLVLQAAEPWSPENHHLFPARARARARFLAKVGNVLAQRYAPLSPSGLGDVWVTAVMPLAVHRHSV